VNGTHNHTDDWGDARGQGPHEGNDIMAARGTPVVAVAEGSIDRLTRTESGLGGIWIWLRDRVGNTYYYAHLTRSPPAWRRAAG
jgi:murein DD-endopeptidase MepM/ murein hydrolase activator NlpD